MNDKNNTHTYTNEDIEVVYNLVNYYKRIPNYATITTLPEKNAQYIKEAFPTVIDCASMLKSCRELTSVDTTGWDTSNVTDMMFMFCDCNKLTTLDISNWDTSKVTDMNYMFSWCNELTTIKGIIDMKSCTKYDGMFMACPKLTSVKIKNPPADFETYSGLNSSQYTIVS